MVPPKISRCSVKKPKSMENHIIIRRPQNQCLPNFFKLELVSTKTPEIKISPANIKEAIPKPRSIKRSLIQAPVLLSQFSGFTSLDVNSVKVFWSTFPVNRKDKKAIKSKMPKRAKKLPSTNFCWLDNLRLGAFNLGLVDLLVFFFAIYNFRNAEMS